MFYPLMNLIYFSINLYTKDVVKFSVNQTKTSSYSNSYKRLFSILLTNVVSFISYRVDFRKLSILLQYYSATTE